MESIFEIRCNRAPLSSPELFKSAAFARRQVFRNEFGVMTRRNGVKVAPELGPKTELTNTSRNIN